MSSNLPTSIKLVASATSFLRFLLRLYEWSTGALLPAENRAVPLMSHSRAKSRAMVRLHERYLADQHGYRGKNS